jgi:hypothetical protein
MTIEEKHLNFRKKERNFSKFKVSIGKKMKNPMVKGNPQIRMVFKWINIIEKFY